MSTSVVGSQRDREEILYLVMTTADRFPSSAEARTYTRVLCDLAFAELGTVEVGMQSRVYRRIRRDPMLWSRVAPYLKYHKFFDIEV